MDFAKWECSQMRVSIPPKAARDKVNSLEIDDPFMGAIIANAAGVRFEIWGMGGAATSSSFDSFTTLYANLSLEEARELARFILDNT